MYARDSGLRQSSGYATPPGNYGRSSAPYSNSPAGAANYAAEAAEAYIREVGGYGRGPSSGGTRPNGPESRFESPRRGDPGAAQDGARDIGCGRIAPASCDSLEAEFLSHMSNGCTCAPPCSPDKRLTALEAECQDMLPGSMADDCE